MENNIYEIYTKNPETNESEWDIVYVRSTDSLIKTFPNFDRIIIKLDTNENLPLPNLWFKKCYAYRTRDCHPKPKIFNWLGGINITTQEQLKKTIDALFTTTIEKVTETREVKDWFIPKYGSREIAEIKKETQKAINDLFTTGEQS